MKNFYIIFIICAITVSYPVGNLFRTSTSRFGEVTNSALEANIGNAVKAHRISVFDDVFKQVSQAEGHDWRLLSAIAFHESRFSPSIVSSQGAVGLMQIMPSVARRFSTSQKELLNPETNVSVAAKLLHKITAALSFEPQTSQRDRLRIILASYNCGIGHVLDARSLAKSEGENPDSWDVVARYLKLKSDAEYYNRDSVKCGRFSGGKRTAKYVNGVMSKYTAYCEKMPKSAAMTAQADIRTNDHSSDKS